MSTAHAPYHIPYRKHERREDEEKEGGRKREEESEREKRKKSKRRKEGGRKGRRLLAIQGREQEKQEKAWGAVPCHLEVQWDFHNHHGLRALKQEERW